MAKYRGKHPYMGAWSYVLLDILYAIPVIGFVFLLSHSFNENDENRQHYARSYFARFILCVVLCIICAGAYFLVVGSDAFVDTFNEITTNVMDYINTLFSL